MADSTPTPTSTPEGAPKLSPEEAVRALSRRRLILTCTTGRSGTGFLTAVLGLVPGLAARHEPRPWLTEVMREAQQDPDLARRFLLEEKLPAMAAVEGKLYAETSHLFCKGFLEPLVELGLRPDLVILSRESRAVALSMLRLETVPGRSVQGLRWYLSPEDPHVLPLPGWQELTDYQLCFWYTQEIARRCRHYESWFCARDLRVARIELARLRTVSGFAGLLRDLDLPRPGLYAWLRLAVNRYTRVNSKRREKVDAAPPGDLDAQEREVLERIGASGGDG
ncbi:MAG: hypothetical protein SX243_00385 [Acidobacteriota bacterium]|nr:hypothetical protein [Acidobacteriota bacterium]